MSELKESLHKVKALHKGRRRIYFQHQDDDNFSFYVPSSWIKNHSLSTGCDIKVMVSNGSIKIREIHDSYGKTRFKPSAKEKESIITESDLIQILSILIEQCERVFLSKETNRQIRLEEERRYQMANDKAKEALKTLYNKETT